MGTEEPCNCEYPCSCATKATLRGELETAWLRGYAAGMRNDDVPDLEAADYAERVVGGSTRPERPEVSQ